MAVGLSSGFALNVAVFSANLALRGEMIGDVFLDDGVTTYAAPPARFEAGTPPILEAIGLGAAIPAYIAYNKFSIDAGKFAGRLDAFADDLQAAVARLWRPRTLKTNAQNETGTRLPMSPRAPQVTVI